MRFTLLTEDEYAAFTTHHRIFVSQTPEYGRVMAEQGTRAEYVGVKDGEEVRAAALITYQPWKKFFSRAHINYGPTMDFTDTPVADAFFTGLRSHLKAKRGLLSCRICPLVKRAFYSDITPTGLNPDLPTIEATLAKHGLSRLFKDFYERSDVQMRFIYTKDIAGLSFEEATATLAKGLRRRFHNEGRYGVEVRFVGPDKYHVFEGLLRRTVERTQMEESSERATRIYRGLLREFGERGLLAIAYLRPRVYLEQIAEERAEISDRLAALAERKPTTKRDNEIAALEKRLPSLDEAEERARDALTHGEEIPINSALGFIISSELLLLLGGMDKRYVAFGRDYPVERAMFKRACDEDLQVYNTFGISGIFDEDAPDAQVLSFKRWLRGNVEEFIGTYDMAVRPLLARRLGALD